MKNKALARTLRNIVCAWMDRRGRSELLVGHLSDTLGMSPTQRLTIQIHFLSPTQEQEMDNGAETGRRSHDVVDAVVFCLSVMMYGYEMWRMGRMGKVGKVGFEVSDVGEEGDEGDEISKVEEDAEQS